MKEFSSLDAFSKHLTKVVEQYPRREKTALNFIGDHLVEKSKEKIGHLQSGDGKFSSWKELADSTKKDKERKGYVFNDEYNPLYRTGELKESIDHSVNQSRHVLYVGSPLDIMLYQEIGTKTIPARSVLGLTMFKEKEQIQYILGLFLYNWIINTNNRLGKR